MPSDTALAIVTQHSAASPMPNALHCLTCCRALHAPDVRTCRLDTSPSFFCFTELPLPFHPKKNLTRVDALLVTVKLATVLKFSPLFYELLIVLVGHRDTLSLVTVTFKKCRARSEGPP
jgi:hypothetical protein